MRPVSTVLLAALGLLLASTATAQRNGDTQRDGDTPRDGDAPRATDGGSTAPPPAAVVEGEDPAHEPPPSHEWPDRIGPFELGDDAARLRLSLIAQLQLQIVDAEQPDGARETDAELRIRRIRPILRGAFADGRIQSTLHLEVGPGQLELIDLFVDATLHPELRLRVGQLKVPFTQYWQQSLVNLATVDWPLTSRYFGGERQLGIMAHDDRRNPEGFLYALGVFAGENRRGAYARELPRIYGESHGNPSSLTDPRPPGDLHAEIVGRVGHFAADVHPETIMDVEGGGFRHGIALSAAWDTDPEHRRDFALRLAPEVLFKWEHLSFTAVGFVGFIETLDEATAPGAVGVLTELGWHAHRHVQLALRYSRVDLLDPLVDDARAYAQSIEPLDPDAHQAWADQYGDVGQLRARHELSLGVNVLILGRSLAWQNDVAWMRTERDDGARDDLRVRSQLQLAF